MELAQYLTTDQMIVYAYLILTLGIGLFVSRNIKDIKDYAIAKRQYGTPVLILTFLATLEGGTSTIGIASGVFSDGMIMTAATFGYVFAFIFVARFIAPRMDRFEGCLTAGDIMEKTYGIAGKQISGLVGFFFCVSIVAAQILALGYTYEQIFHTKSTWGILVSGIILVIYASVGGIKSVTITDVIQFTILIIIVPLIASVAINEVGGITSLLNQLPEEKLVILESPKLTEYVILFLVWGLFPAFLLSPPFIQRMLLAQNKRQIITMFYVGAAFTIPFELIVMCIGFAAYILAPEINPTLALPHIIDTMLPTVIRGLAVAGILAVIMSTADSFLNTSGLLLVHDVIKPFFKSSLDSKELLITRLSTFFIGALAMVVAIYASNIIQLEFYAVSLLAPIVTIPLILAIREVGIPKSALPKATYLTLLVFAVSCFLLPKDQLYFAPLISIVCNGLIYFILYYGQKEAPLPLTPVISPFAPTSHKNYYINCLKLALPTFTNLQRYCTTKVELYGANYALFGVFCCLNYIVPFFMWTYKEPSHYPIMLGLRLIAGVLCVILLLKEYWPEKLKRYFPVYWYATLLYCLPILTTTMYLIDRGSPEWLINVALAIFLLGVLVDWLSFIVLMLLGVLLGRLLYTCLIDQAIASLSFERAYLLIYVVIYTTLIALIFARKKEYDAQERLQTMKLFGSVIAHEMRSPLATIQMYNEELRGRQKAEDLFLCETIDKVSSQTQRIIDTMLMNIKSEVIATDTAVYSIRQTVEEALSTYGFTDEERKKVVLVKGVEDFVYRGSQQYVQHIFFNLIKNALFYTRKQPDASITIWIEDYCVHVKDTGPGIPPEELSNIFKRFYTRSSKGTGIGLAFCKMVMDSLGGSIYCRSHIGSYTEFILLFPKI